MKIIKILTSNDQIEEACALLYVVYIERMNWHFSPDNPSKLKIEIRNNRKLLVDRFTDKAVWFGAFQDDKLIACIRVLGPDENNKLELEGYESSQIVQPYIVSPREKCIELGKFAVLNGYVSSGTIKSLFLDVFKYCDERKYSVISCTRNSFFRSFFRRIGLPLKMGQAFKYEPQDHAPVDFYLADHAKMEVAKIINSLERLDKRHRAQTTEIFKALEIAAPLLPNPVYWQDRQGVVLGINDHCLEAMGTSREIIGKTPYEFYPKETAELILNHHNLVMDTGEILAQEERINDITTGKEKYFSSIKAPLYDDEGHVIGIVGTSVDITAEKESERLKIENEKLEIENRFQNRLIQEQGNFKKIIDQAVHDIRSPLASLSILSSYTKNIPPDFCAVMGGALRRINDIANNLLEKYKPRDETKIKGGDVTDVKNTFQVLLALYEIVSEKKYEFQDVPVDIKISLSPTGYSSFIYAGEISFKRMISNLINNAVEAFEKTPGAVSINLDSTDSMVIITMEDNGKGMPQHVLDKIRNNVAVTEGKKSGHGIGFTQVRETLRYNRGYLDIDSTVGSGTKIVLTFPKSESPFWVAEKIELKNDDVILVLDDDPTIHKAWELRLKEKLTDNRVHCFASGDDVIQFIEKFSPEQKEKALLLADYELLYQELNGLEIIEKSKITHSILVTSHYSNHAVLDELKEAKVKILPKLFISEIPVNVLKA